MVFPHVVPELPSGSYRSDGGVHRKEVTPLSEGVDHNHNRIVSIQLRKFDNEVHTHRVPASFRRRKRFEMTGWQLPLDFGSETEVACGSILTNILRHLRPPVISTHQFQCLPPTRMTCNPAVMVECYNLPTDVGSRGFRWPPTTWRSGWTLRKWTSTLSLLCLPHPRVLCPESLVG
jgi:hypothetical protein